MCIRSRKYLLPSPQSPSRTIKTRCGPTGVWLSSWKFGEFEIETREGDRLTKPLPSSSRFSLVNICLYLSCSSLTTQLLPSPGAWSSPKQRDEHNPPGRRYLAAMASQANIDKMQLRQSYRNVWHTDLMRTIQADTPCKPTSLSYPLCSPCLFICNGQLPVLFWHNRISLCLSVAVDCCFALWWYALWNSWLRDSPCTMDLSMYFGFVPFKFVVIDSASYWLLSLMIVLINSQFLSGLMTWPDWSWLRCPWLWSCTFYISCCFSRLILHVWLNTGTCLALNSFSG